MVELTALWLPILLSAVVVFAASSVIHMALTYHQSDFKPMANEPNVLEAMRNAGVQPGDYFFPYAPSMSELKKPEVMEKFNKGPVGMMSVIPNGPPAMGKNLVQWFVFCLVIGVFVAYLTGRTLNAGEEYMAVFRIAGTVGFLGYGPAQATDSIWMGRTWRVTSKHMFDGLVYGLLTAGVFGWLWP